MKEISGKRALVLLVLFFLNYIIVSTWEISPLMPTVLEGMLVGMITLGALITVFKIDEGIVQFLQIRWARALRCLAKTRWYQELVHEIGETILRIKKGGA